MWRARPVGRTSPTTDLGRTAEDFKAAFPEYYSASMRYGNATLPGPSTLMAICRPATGWNIENGEVFHVRMQKKHIMKMKLSLDLRWAVTKIMAMAGGADSLDCLRDNHQFLGGGGFFPGLDADISAMREESEDGEGRDQDYLLAMSFTSSSFGSSNEALTLE
ncbi:hypothetical protein B0H67DRAFT_642787 [Lasiosphaeris hirsuta]|uniref:Uncharacterized protein n=1 Tax=Lasiosphaeris hirsuta TaxID=260670 RepID=A0AA40AP46_9PEZI|nr:hypothetical protein B0H67DRAFT_642787 [Lasiosphaeris hirsuta]